LLKRWRCWPPRQARISTVAPAGNRRCHGIGSPADRAGQVALDNRVGALAVLAGRDLVGIFTAKYQKMTAKGTVASARKASLTNT
jgi:hypothetical protein